MMRVAGDLSEVDIDVLAELKRAYPLRVSGPGRDRYIRMSAAAMFDQIARTELGYSWQELESVFSKLSSFGLIARLAGNVSKVGMTDGERTAYELLRKGWDFLEYIQSSSDEHQVSGPGRKGAISVAISRGEHTRLRRPFVTLPSSVSYRSVNAARLCANNVALTMASSALSEMMDRVNKRLRANMEDARMRRSFTAHLRVVGKLFWGVAPISEQNRGDNVWTGIALSIS
jgi:hypothetical protein